MCSCKQFLRFELRRCRDVKEKLVEKHSNLSVWIKEQMQLCSYLCCERSFGCRIISVHISVSH